MKCGLGVCTGGKGWGDICGVHVCAHMPAFPIPLHTSVLSLLLGLTLFFFAGAKRDTSIEEVWERGREGRQSRGGGGGTGRQWDRKEKGGSWVEERNGCVTGDGEGTRDTGCQGDRQRW